MPSGLIFHHGEDIPRSMRNLPDGVQEVTVDGITLPVFAGRSASGPYVVVDHGSDYEQVELAVYSLLGLGFLGFIAMSLVLGRYMARKFVTPIVTLSNAVAEGASELPLQDSHDEIGILARAFTRHTSELQQFLDRERYFTGDVSHELRTPLTIIAGAAEILSVETRDQPRLQAPVERITRAVRDANDSVAILLLLARSPELIESELLSIAEVISVELERSAPLVAGKPVSLVDAGGPDFTVRAPAPLVAALLSNLIRNACLYTGHGTVTVLRHAGEVVISDSGKGLPPAVRAMLGGASTALPQRGSEGTGLGLALVMRICRYLNVTLAVADAPGGGTVFTLRFAPP